MTGQGSPKFVFSILTAKYVLVMALYAALFWILVPSVTLGIVQDRDSVQPSTLALKSPTKLLPTASIFRFDSEAGSRSAEKQDLRFRVSWGGGLPQTWAGTVTVKKI